MCKFWVNLNTQGFVAFTQNIKIHVVSFRKVHTGRLGQAPPPPSLPLVNVCLEYCLVIKILIFLYMSPDFNQLMLQS